MTKTIRKSFNEYNKDNPATYRLFKAKAEALYKRGIRHYSAWAILTNIRVSHDTRVKNSRFKINNDHIALFARKLMREDAKFRGFFTTKALKRA